MAEPLTESYFYILLCLCERPMHGYGIMQRTAELSGGRVKIGSGTMYGATGSMLKKGWIEEYMGVSGDERRRMYRLTERGRACLEEERLRLRELVRNAEAIMEENDDEKDAH